MPLLIVLLVLSNIAMTAAWFTHLRYPGWPWWQAVLVSWAIALVEYAIAIPALRYAHERGITPASIKITQEAVTLTVFAAVIGLILSQTGLTWRFAVASGLLVAAVAVIAVPSR